MKVLARLYHRFFGSLPALMLVAAVWFFVAVFVVVPHFEGSRSPYLSYYNQLSGDAAAGRGQGHWSGWPPAGTLRDGRYPGARFHSYETRQSASSRH